MPPKGPEIQATWTAYFKINTAQEGGCSDRQGLPLCNYSQFIRGECLYVSVAADPTGFSVWHSVGES